MLQLYDKRYILDDEVTTLAYGGTDIVEQVMSGRSAQGSSEVVYPHDVYGPLPRLHYTKHRRAARCAISLRVVELF